MTKSKIKAELRRSACEDCVPWYGVNFQAFNEACDWTVDVILKHEENDSVRTFFLLVAEAL